MVPLIDSIKSKPSRLLPLALAFAAVGAVFLLRTYAATGTISVEAEDGTVAGTAVAATIPDASGGSAVTVGISPQDGPTVVRSLNYHPFSGHLEQSLPKFVEGRIQSVRLNFHWNEFQPDAKGQWNQGYAEWMDRFEEFAHQHNIKILAIAMLSPGWANGGQGPNSRNFKDSDFCDYIKDIEARWGRSIEAYEIWNEPGLDGFMQGTQAEKAARYAQVLKSSYACIKSFDPDRPVLGGSLYQPVWNNQDFLRMLYRDHGIKGHYDILSQHMYGDNSGHAQGYGGLPAPLTYRQLYDAIKNNTIKTLAEFGDEDKPIWVTETGVNTTSGGNSEALQAERLGEAYDLLKEGYLPTLKRVYWYQFEEHKDMDPHEYEFRLGILSWEGSAFRNKPAFDVLKSK